MLKAGDERLHKSRTRPRRVCRSVCLSWRPLAEPTLGCLPARRESSRRGARWVAYPAGARSGCAQGYSRLGLAESCAMCRRGPGNGGGPLPVAIPLRSLSTPRPARAPSPFLRSPPITSSTSFRPTTVPPGFPSPRETLLSGPTVIALCNIWGRFTENRNNKMKK